jgi:hypothetical protein
VRGGESRVSEVVALLQRVEQFAEPLHKSRDLTNAKEAADFLRMPYSELRRLAPYLPRHRLTERRRGHRRLEETGVIQSKQRVFEMARARFGSHDQERM